MITNGPGLTLEQILSAEDLQPEGVDCPEWGGTVYIRGVSGNTRDEIEERITDAGTNVGLRALIVSRGLCDANGVLLELSTKQVHELGEKSAGVLNRLAERIQKRSGMTADDVEKLEGNLESVQSDGSG